MKLGLSTTPIDTFLGKFFLASCFIDLGKVNRLSLALVSAEASLTEARSKVELLSRQLKNIQQSVEASQGLEMDVERLKKDAEETARKVDQTTKEKDVSQ